MLINDICSALIALFFTIIAISLLKWLKLVIELRRAPGPRPRWPLIGNIPLFLKRNQSLSKTIYTTLSDLSERFESDGMFVLFFGSKPWVYLFRPQYVAEILRNQDFINKSFEYNYLKPWLGDGLITSNGAVWKTKRKLLSPSFHSKILEDYISVINEETKIFNQILSTHSDKECFDIRPLITNLTLDIISVTAMGVSIGAQKNENHEYVHHLNNALKIFMKRTFNSFYANDAMFAFTKSGREYRNSINIMHKFTENIIEKRKQLQTNNLREAQRTRRMNFLDLLLALQSSDASITDQMIREDVDTFMFAGHDTTSVCLTWTLFLLGHHSGVQRKIKEEIYSIFGNDTEREIVSDDINRMTYIECVIKESLRLFQPVPIIGRIAEKSFSIEGHRFPKGTSVYLNLMKTHRSKEVLKQPDDFVPERFQTEDVQRAFFPFASGPRNCIGQRFAMIEMKIIVASIFRKFSVKSLDEESQLEKTIDVVYKPLSPIRIMCFKE